MKAKKGKKIKTAIRRQIRRAKKQDREIDFNVSDWDYAIDWFANKCAYCDTDMENNATIEHIYPSSKGGGLTYDNIIPACNACNEEKGNKTLLEYAESQHEKFKRGRNMYISRYISEARMRRNDEIEMERY